MENKLKNIEVFVYYTKIIEKKIEIPKGISFDDIGCNFLPDVNGVYKEVSIFFKPFLKNEFLNFKIDVNDFTEVENYHWKTHLLDTDTFEEKSFFEGEHY